MTVNILLQKNTCGKSLLLITELVHCQFDFEKPNTANLSRIFRQLNI